MSDARPIVYLDQNHWSTLAKVARGSRPVPTAQADAARVIIDMAREQQIRLPVSAGHISETGQWSDRELRYQLALTMLELSRGWQMRDPLDIRHLEIRRALAIRINRMDLIVDRETFTLEPATVFGSSRSDRSPSLIATGTDSLDYAVHALASLSALFDTLLHPEAVLQGDVTGWVDKAQRLTNQLASEPHSEQARREMTNRFFLDDLRPEFLHQARESAVTPSQWVTWLNEQSDDDISQMPSLGLYREVLREKVLNPGTTWESNDLTDLVYLTCAAGYADHTVGERSLTSAIENGLRRLGRTTSVHRSLRSLVDALDVAGVTRS